MRFAVGLLGFALGWRHFLGALLLHRFAAELAGALGGTLLAVHNAITVDVQALFCKLARLGWSLRGFICGG
jgi:hypothetical protein